MNLHYFFYAHIFEVDGQFHEVFSNKVKKSTLLYNTST